MLNSRALSTGNYKIVNSNLEGVRICIDENLKSNPNTTAVQSSAILNQGKLSLLLDF